MRKMSSGSIVIRGCSCDVEEIKTGLLWDYEKKANCSRKTRDGRRKKQLSLSLFVFPSQILAYGVTNKCTAVYCCCTMNMYQLCHNPRQDAIESDGQRRGVAIVTLHQVGAAGFISSASSRDGDNALNFLCSGSQTRLEN